MIPFQTMQPVTHLYPLPRCRVQIFEDPGDGYAGVAVWEAKQVDDLRLGETIRRVETFPTGIPYPSRKAMEGIHSIVFTSVWNVDAILVRDREYIMVVTWLDATLADAAKAWRRRCYFKVTTDNRNLSAKGGDEFGGDTTLTAGYYQETDGTGTPADIVQGSEVCL